MLDPQDEFDLYDFWYPLLLLGLISFALGVFLSACSLLGKDSFVPDKNAVYRYDLPLRINGRVIEGVGIAPSGSDYEIEVDPPGKIDRISWRTCHRNGIVNKPDTGWGGKYKFRIRLVEGIEDVASCAMEITVLEEKKKRNAFALVEFPDRRSNVDLVANLSCNGAVVQNHGVSICQSQVGLIQEIAFGAPVRFSKKLPQECAVLEQKDTKTVRFFMPKGTCTFYFGTEDGHLHRLSTVGYTDVPPILE